MSTPEQRRAEAAKRNAEWKKLSPAEREARRKAEHDTADVAYWAKLANMFPTEREAFFKKYYWYERVQMPWKPWPQTETTGLKGAELDEARKKRNAEIKAIDEAWLARLSREQFAEHCRLEAVDEERDRQAAEAAAVSQRRCEEEYARECAEADGQTLQPKEPTRQSTNNAGNPWPNVRNFPKFMKIGAPSFEAADWWEAVSETKESQCPWHDDHTEQNTGFAAKNASDSENGFGAWCMHSCGHDPDRGQGANGKQDRAKYLYAKCVQVGVIDAAELLGYCNDEARAAWSAKVSNGKSKASTSPAQRRLMYRAAADIDSKNVDWLFHKFLPRRMISILAGPTGVGKSQAAIQLIAAATTGKDHTIGSRTRATATPVRKPVSAVLITGEDTAEETVRPRLEAAGADLSRVFVVHGVEVTGADGAVEEQRFSFEHAKESLATILEDHPDIGLLVIEPINSFIGKIDAHRNNEVHDALQPIWDLANKHNLAVLLCHHTRKDTKFTNITDMLGGSNAFAEMARMVSYLTWENPADQENNRFVFELVKNNYVKPGWRCMYEIEECHVRNRAGEMVETQRFNFLEGEKVTMSVYRAMSGAAADEDKQAKLEAAKEMLHRMLGDGRQMQSDAILAAGKKAGISEGTMYRAKKELKVSSRRVGFGPESKCFWSMSDTRTEAEKAADVEATRQADEMAASKRVSDRIVSYRKDNPDETEEAATAAVMAAEAGERLAAAKQLARRAMGL